MEFNEGVEHLINKIEEGNSVISIAGGSCSGKTTLHNILRKEYNITSFPLDAYYKKKEDRTSDNFDHPDALDLGLARTQLYILKQGKTIDMPVYSFTEHDRIGSEKVKPSGIIVMEGIFALHDMFNSISDYKVFVESSIDNMKKRRIERDQKERGRSYESIENQLNEQVIPMHKKYVQPQMQKADIVIYNNKEMDTQMFGYTGTESKHL